MTLISVYRALLLLFLAIGIAGPPFQKKSSKALVAYQRFAWYLK